MSERMKPIGEALAPLFADLKRRSDAVAELTTRVRNALPGPEKDHVLSASYREDTLVIETDSAAWAVHIRYAQNELLSRVNSTRSPDETQVTKLKVKVGRTSQSGSRMADRSG
jgi:hypothetical protein